MSTINLDGSPVLIEVLVWRHHSPMLIEHDCIDDARWTLEHGGDDGQCAPDALFVEGELHSACVLGGDVEFPSPERADELRAHYVKARELGA